MLFCGSPTSDHQQEKTLWVILAVVLVLYVSEWLTT